ncbi:hypothetical protein ASD67_00120 [Sphingopyxis sp. Root1497]|nr:hypothetical protein ASD67_00120 [Sphingopyxis sp. Root1497]
MTMQESAWASEDRQREAETSLISAITDPAAVERRRAWQDAPIAADGLGDRLYNFGKKSALRIGSGGSRVIAAGMNAIDEGFGDGVTQRADDVDQWLGRRVEGETTLDDLKTNFSLSGLGSFVAEQGVGSAADMAMLATGAGIVPYAVAQAGNIGQQRAQNNDSGTATLTDIAAAAPAAVASTALERLGTKYLLPGADDAGNVLVRLGSSAVSEGLTEAGQTGVEYTGSTLGTDRGFDLGDALQQSLDAGITGGLTGPGLKTVMTEAPRAARGVVDKGVTMLADRQERRDFSPLANAIAVDAFRPTQAAPAPVAAPAAVAPKKVAPAPKAAPVITVEEPVAPAAVEVPKVEPAAAETKSDDVSLTPTGDQNYRQLWQKSRPELEALRATAPREADVDEGVTSAEVIDEILREHQDYAAMDDDTLVGIVRRQVINNRDADWVKRVQEGRGDPGQQASFVSFIGAMGALRNRPDGANLTDRVVDQLVDQGWSKADAQEVVEYRFENLTGKKPGEARAKPAATPTTALALPAPAKPPIAAREETRRVTIPTGGKIDVRMELVSADDITQAEGSKQNRDRDRAASEAQIMAIVGKFDPEQLGDDNYTDRGAPIIGPDGTIESGNGRVLAINRVFDERPELAQQYRDYIESQGFDTKGVDRPVLIRRRVTEMDEPTLRQFITGSNSDTKQELSAPERATQDASDILTPDTMAKYMGGALVSQRNGDFIRKFIEAVPDGQRSTFMDEKGNLSTAGVARIENAMLARAFGNGTPAAKRFLSKAMENTDNQTRTLTGALSEVAADWGRMTATMDEGTVDKKYDLTDKVLEAIGMVADARAQGKKISDVFAQRDAFDQIDPMVEKIIRSFYDGNLRRAAGRAKVAGILRSYAELASEQRADADLFGNAAPPTTSDLYATAIEHQHEADLLATAADAGMEAKTQKGARSDHPKRQASNDDDIPDIDAPDAERVPSPVADRAGYDPEFLERSFTNRASFFGGVVRTALGMDPEKFVLLPGPRQIYLLTRAVEKAFGITVTVDRQLQDRFAIDQMLDMLQNVQGMAAILGIPARGMSLGGKLSLSIEKKARALGWFQPGTSMIGLPRRSNSFAHEWGHALDFYLLAKIGSTENDIAGRGLSGAIRQMGESLNDAEGIPNRNIRDGFIHLLNTMFFDKAGLATRVLDLEAKISKTSSDKVRADLQRQIDNITAGSAKPRGITSDFAKLSKAFGAKAGTQEYWTSPTEMLARAFEAYVSYKAESAGMSTEFIGKGDAAYLSDADERFAQTFPKGTERLRIFDAFDNIFAHIATQETLGEGAAAMPDPANKASRNPFERPETVAPAERNIFRLAVGAEFDAIWSHGEARRKRLRDRPANDDASILRHMHDTLSYFKYGMTARLKMIGRRYNAPSVIKLHNMLTHTAGDKSKGRDYLRAIDLRMNQYQNRVDRVVGNYNAELNRSRSRELSIAESDHLRDLLTSTESTAESKPMQALAASLRKLSDDIFYDMQRAGIDVGYARNGYLQRLYDDAIIGGDEAGFLSQAAKAYKIAFERQWGDSNAVLADDEAMPTFLAAARDLSRKGHDSVVAPYAAFAKIKKQIASLNRAIAAAEKASEDTGTMQAQLAALDEDLREAFADLYDVVEAAWSTQAAADWLLKIQSSNPHDVDSRGPDGNFLKGRELPPEADKLLEKYMVRDPVNVMMLYSGKVARRIEYAERFGADNKKIDALFVQMGREGVSAVGQDQVRAIFDVVTGRSVSTLPPGVNWAFEAIHVIWGTISLLPRAVWSSMSESFTAGIHAGNAKFAFKATGDLLASIVKTDGSKARADLARFAGIVSARGGHAVLTERYGGSYANDTFLSDAATRMFYNTGLVALTRAQQGQMVGTAHAFLDCMSGWVVDGASAAPASKAHVRRADAIARLEEYGVSDPDAFARRMRAFDGLPTPADLAEGDAFTHDWTTAVDRFIKGSIQSPTVMSRPQAASSAFGRLAYGIMSFNYEFYRNIIKGSAIRVARQYERRRDIALEVGDGKKTANAKAAAAIAPQVAGGLLASAAVLVAGQLLVSTIRMFLFDQEKWKELDEKDELAGYLVSTALSRTFATPLDPMIQAYTGWKYNGSMFSNLAGPAPANIVQQLDAIGKASVRNSEKTNTAEYNRAKAIYRLGIGPGAGMALQFIPGGPYISGAAGLATMAVTSSTMADGFAEALIGEKGSVTDPETGEVIGPPKKKGEAAAPKYAF